MVRSLLLSIALLFSFVCLAQPDVLPRPVRRTQSENQCVCVQAPCRCADYLQDLERQRNKPIALSHCEGGSHLLVQVGAHDICTYSDVGCLMAKSDKPTEYTEVTRNVYCAKPATGGCPRPRDLTECATSEDVSASDVAKIEKVLIGNCTPSTATAAAVPSSRPAASARRNQ